MAATTRTEIWKSLVEEAYARAPVLRGWILSACGNSSGSSNRNLRRTAAIFYRGESNGSRGRRFQRRWEAGLGSGKRLRNSACGNGSPGVVSILLGNGNGTFRTRVDYAVGNDPVGIAVGDFNGDGKMDLAVANRLSSSVSVLFGNGDGTFQSHVDYGTGGTPTSVAVGDFNGDGKLDLAVADNGVSVFLNSGNGTFPTRTDFSTGVGPTAVTVGDFNEDGNLDLAVATECGLTNGCNQDQGPASVSVLLGNGNGTFQTQVNYPISATEPVSITAADLNGDGFLDLAVASSGVPYNSGSVTVLWGSGNGTFTDQGFGSGIGPSSVVVGDFNGDGQLDFAVTNTKDETVSVFLNQGGNNFSQPKIFYGGGAFPFGGVAGDFNGDHKLDVAVGCGNAVCILLGDGSGGFSQTPLSYTAGYGANAVAVADLNGDQKNDIVVANYLDGTVSVFLGSGGGAFQPPVSYNVGPWISVAIADLNGDGKPDLVVTNGDVAVLLNNGDGTFQAPVAYGTAAGAYSTAIGDLNGDGKLDLAVACSGGGSVSILLGNGDGTTGTVQDFAIATTSQTSLTMTPGQAANYAVSISPVNGFNQAVQLSCSGAPALASCTVTPTSVTLDGSGNVAANVAVVTTAATTGLTQPYGGPPANNRFGSWSAALGGVALVLLASLMGGWRQRSPRWIRRSAFLCLLVLGLAITGCGGSSPSGGGGTTGTSAGTYNLTVTGIFKSGSTTLTHATKLTLVVQ
jgi:hypothetical protein